MKAEPICISVVIPCFNAGATLHEAIQSVVAERNCAREIVIVDDGSSDNSLAVARQFEPAIRILTGPNRGVSAARNRGIAETTGEWIVFLDSDDLLLSGTLGMRAEVARATGADVVACDWQQLFGQGSGAKDGPVTSADMVALAADAEIACATSFWATTAALMYRRSLVEKIGGFRADLPVLQDARFLFEAAYHGARFAHSPHIGARHRVLPESLSRKDPALFWRDVLLNGKQIEALWRARGALSARQLGALCDIYNGAAHGLFRACDPSFREGLAALRASLLSVSSRNRFAEMMSDIAGQSSAVRMARFWTWSRCLLTKSITAY
jgi:hypothetical protein